MSFVKRAYQYAMDVVEGDIPACLYVRQSCNRFLADLEYAQDEEEFWFDTDWVNRLCSRIENFEHVKGKWASRQEKFKLSDWQVFIVANLSLIAMEG